MALSFKNAGCEALGDRTTYLVFRGDVQIGRVDKVGRWTVRGTSYSWKALTKGGTYLAGPYDTRKEAAQKVEEAYNLRFPQKDA